jgi:hypothetical protein
MAVKCHEPLEFIKRLMHTPQSEGLVVLFQSPRGEASQT